MITIVLTIIGLALLGIIVGAIVSPEFKNGLFQFLRIKSNNALNSATTPVDRLQDDHDQLVAKLPGLRQNVTSVMGKATLAHTELQNRQTAVTEIEEQFQLATSAKASPAAMTELGSRYSDAQAAVTEQTAIVAEYDKQADEAQKSLDDTIAAIKKDASRVKSAESSFELAQAIETSTAVKNQQNDIKNALSKASKAQQEIDEKLAQARAGQQLAQGSAVDRELEALKGKKTADDGLAALQAKFAPAAPAPVAKA